MRYAHAHAEWRLVAAILPCKGRGVPRVDDRRVLNGIFQEKRAANVLAFVKLAAIRLWLRDHECAA